MKQTCSLVQVGGEIEGGRRARTTLDFAGRPESLIFFLSWLSSSKSGAGLADG